MLGMRSGSRGGSWARVRRVAAGCVLSLGLAPWAVGQDGSAPRSRPTIAIVGVEPTEAVEANARRDGSADSLALISDALDGQLVSALSATGRFSVVARTALERLLDEQDLQQVFARDPVTALNTIGARYGVDFRIDGFRDSYVEERTRAEGSAGRIARARRTVFVSVVATVYDIEAGTALESVTTEYRDTPLAMDWGAMGADREVVEDLMADSLDGVARDLAQDVARSVLYRTFPARVLLAEAGQVYLSWGEGTPIEPGQAWEIFDVVRVEDFDFPGEFVEIERLVGRVRVETVSPRNSSARVLEDLGIERGAIARLAPEDEDPDASGDGEG